MFKRKDKKKDRSEQFIEESSPLSYPIGQAAQTLGMSKRTLMRRAEAMGLEFDWDGRGRRVRRDDLQRLLSGERLDKKSNALAESDENDSAFDEEDELLTLVVDQYKSRASQKKMCFDLGRFFLCAPQLQAIS